MPDWTAVGLTSEETCGPEVRVIGQVALLKERVFSLLHPCHFSWNL